MLFLVLRILCAPLSVLLGTFAQRRFGHAVGGLIVGLPLLFLPFLWLIGHEYGFAFARTMSASLLIAASAEVALMWTFAFLAQKYSASTSMLGALGAFATVATLLRFAHVSVVLGALVAVVGFALALSLWPRSIPVEHLPGKSRLGLRLVVATVFTVALISLAGRLGASLSGVLDAIPLTTLMMAFFTRRETSAEASSAFLRGVTRGSFSFIAATLVLAEMLRTGDVWGAFVAALVAALIVQFLVQSSGSMTRLARFLVSEKTAELLGDHVTPLVPGAPTFKKFYESISV